MRTLLTIFFALMPFSAIAIPCPRTLECPDGAVFHRQDQSQWCAKGDEPHGPVIACDHEGHLIMQDHYQDGVRHGLSRRYTATGQLIHEETFVHGGVHGVSKSWHPSTGTLARRAHFRDGKQTGRTETWHPNGARQSIGDFLDGKPHGEHQRYHANNWIAEVAHFDRGKLVGEYASFSDVGEVEVRGHYRDGLKVGEWLENLGYGAARGAYDDGKKVGEWRYFSDEDTPLRVENYRQGLLHGAYERYEEGQLVEKGAYVHHLQDGVWETFSGATVATRKTWDEAMLLESCELTKRGKMKCRSHTPFRVLWPWCKTELPSSRFIDTEAEFHEHFECSVAPSIDWDRHHLFVHRDAVDPYEVRFAGVEGDGATQQLVLEHHQVCRGTPPPPPKVRWITLVIPRSIERLETTVRAVPSGRDCSAVP